MGNSSKVLKGSGYQWESVPRKEYKDEVSCYKGVHRYSLLGEREAEQSLNFHTRYFEIEADGYTSFEYHRHPHSVIIIRGSGTVILGDTLHNISLHDVVFVAPGTLHQFHADRGEPLGFICTVDRYRDRPTLPDDDTREEHISTETVRNKIRR